MKGKKCVLYLFICMSIVIMAITGCSKKQSASVNSRMIPNEAASISTTQNKAGEDNSQSNAQPNAQSNSQSNVQSDLQVDNNSSEMTGYNCDIEKDKKNFNGKADIVVGDNLFTTQINDWYMNFDKYEGKSVEIEGYFINDYAPYTFVGRYGPSCPYCNGGYVSFEFYTQNDLSEFKSVQDWIKVIGILRQGKDESGVFYYIEVLSLEKMDKVGKDTVTN